MDEYLNQLDAAQYCDVPNSTFRLWRLKGRGPKFYEFGARTFRWKREVLDAWLAERNSH